MILARCAIVMLGLLASSLVYGASQRTFVSTSGINNPACSIASPCRDFASAIAATSLDGEIIVLESGGYGSVTIAQSVSIISPPGVYAGISVFAGDGVIIAAGASGKVTLRGLTINGQPGSSNGIVVTSGAEVHVEQCIVTNMAGDGVRINGGTRIHVRGSIARSNGQHGLNVTAGAPIVRVIDSQFSRNAGHGINVASGSLDAARIAADENGNNGVRAQPVSAVTVTVTLADSALSGNGLTGAVAIPNFAGSTTRLAIARSSSARNSGGGFGTNTMGLGTSFLTVSDSAALENGGNGVIVSGTNAIGIVTSSTVARSNGPDFDQGGGSAFRSSGNNTLTGRGVADVTGTITANPTQ